MKSMSWPHFVWWRTLNPRSVMRLHGESLVASLMAALNHVTRLLDLSLAPHIRVNAVAPDLVDTPMTANWMQAQQIWKEQAPMRINRLAISDAIGRPLRVDGRRPR